MNSETLLITNYISAWMRFLIAIIFFISFILALVLENFIAAFAFGISFLIMGLMAFKRKKEVENES